MSGFEDFLDILDEDEFEEKPVDLRTFVESKDYLGLPPLSELQYTLVEASTQIYKRETLHKLYGTQEGERVWKQTVDEVIAQLGKGSGKDYCSTISIARIVYLLLCLKDPAAYYGKPPGDSIDILNIAINSQQAKNVFFKGFKTRIEKSPWFVGKYIPKAESIEFDKNITCYSGHSERESWEGYNVLVVILDEIAGFALESTSGNEQAKTAEAIYKMYRGSVVSRFEEGKVILLSFPRYKNDFIQQRYNSVIGNVETTTKSYTFKIDPDLPDGFEGNEFTIEWEYDEITHYRTPNVFAIKRASWEVNPTKNINHYKKEFFEDPVDALSRFACMPPEAIDAFFKSREKVEKAFAGLNNPFDESWRFREWFQPREGKRYFVHVDLAKKHDHCAVALAHVETWVMPRIAQEFGEPSPLVKVDAVRYWTPKSNQEVDFAEVRQYIMSLKQRGFDIRMVTFDRWQSYDMMDYLRANGIEAERLSVAKKHYDDFQMVIQEERVKGYKIDLLIEEMLQLRLMRGDKVDHPRKGSKDLSDAVCGAIYNAVALTPRNAGDPVEIDVYTDVPITKQTNFITGKPDETVIRAPKGVAPPVELMEYFAQMGVI